MLKLMYITNNPEIAKIAENSGVDRIFLDLEIIGKEERQGHLDTVISRHNVDDIVSLKDCLKKSELLVRSNPIYDGSKEEIDKIIEYGADIIMLPYFKTVEEVKTFLNIVNGRTKTCLLVETPEAVEVIDDILSLDGIDEVHIGLNDLHLGYGLTFMFELLSNGTVDMLCRKFKEKGIPYGFGGIASMGKGMLPSEHVIAEHYRLGSTRAILSRSFCNTDKIKDLDEINQVFVEGMKEIRAFEAQIENATETFFANNNKSVEQIIAKIVEEKNKNKSE
ncbi:MAG: aldolase/citrate lyase family protein [Acutalibacteraceae bacterium]